MNAATNPVFELRPARPQDVGELLAMIRELAVFEDLTHLLEVDAARQKGQKSARNCAAEAAALKP